MNLCRILLAAHIGLIFIAPQHIVWAGEEKPIAPKKEISEAAPEPYVFIPNSDPETRMAEAQRALKSILPPTQRTQTELLDYIVEKVGRKLVPAIPNPKKDLLTWQRDRHEATLDGLMNGDVVKQPKVLYLLAYRDLLIVRELLLREDLEQRRVGMLMAFYTDLRIAGSLKDARLRAGIYEAFLLPNIDAAKPSGGLDPISIQSLLQDAAGRYGAVKELDKQIAILQLLAKVAEHLNAADRARYKLASVWANLEMYSKAIAVLNEITSQELQNKKWIAALEKKQLTKEKK